MALGGAARFVSGGPYFAVPPARDRLDSSVTATLKSMILQPVVGPHQVSRLDVAVDHAVLMQELKAGRHVDAEPDGVRGAECPHP